MKDDGFQHGWFLLWGGVRVIIAQRGEDVKEIQDMRYKIQDIKYGGGTLNPAEHSSASSCTDRVEMGRLLAA
jgi:hypothetical protein